MSQSSQPLSSLAFHYMRSYHVCSCNSCALPSSFLLYAPSARGDQHPHQDEKRQHLPCRPGRLPPFNLKCLKETSALSSLTSGFAESNEKIYITETCKIQVILQMTKENEYEPSIEQSTGEHKQHFPKISQIDERYPLDRPSIVSISLPLRRRHEADRSS